MALQDRSLSGLTTAASGVATILALTGAAQTMHTLDTGSLSLVDLFINNPSAAPIACTVSVMGVLIVVNVPAFSILQILNQAPLRGSTVGGANNLITALGNLCIAWGRVSVA